MEVDFSRVPEKLFLMTFEINREILHSHFNLKILLWRVYLSLIRINIEGQMITRTHLIDRHTKTTETKKNDCDPLHHYLSTPRYHPKNTRQHHSGTSPTNKETASSRRLLQRSTAAKDKGRKRRCESFPFEPYSRNNIIRLHGVIRKQGRQRQQASFTSRCDIHRAVLYSSRIVGAWLAGLKPQVIMCVG